MINTRNVVLAVRDVPDHAVHTVNNIRCAVFKDAAVFFHIDDIAKRLGIPDNWAYLERKLRASRAISITHIIPLETKRRGFFLRSDATLSLVDQLIHDARSHYTRFCRQTFRDEVLIPTTIELAALARVAANPPSNDR